MSTLFDVDKPGFSILVSNDDGYDSPGLLALVRELRKFADVRVCAPLANMSGASSSLTFETVTVNIDEERGIVVHGTPTDCVHLALVADGLLPWRPDLTVSGINMGCNIADDAMYSGTIAAAAESVQLGVPSIAFSLGSRPARHFPPKHIDDAAVIAADLVLAFKDRLARNKETMLNINIPDLPAEYVKEPAVCRLDMSHMQHDIEPMEEGGEPVESINLKDIKLVAATEEESNTDIWKVMDGHISITPLNFDLTDRDKIERVEKWLAT